MNKPLIATIVFNSERITRECFLPSLMKTSNASEFDLLIVNTDNNNFKIDQQLSNSINVTNVNYRNLFNITMHAPAVQKILDENAANYDDIIICENDVIIKKDILKIIDREYQFCGQLSHTAMRGWFTEFFNKFRLQCNRYFPMLMYFNIPSFEERHVKYFSSDVTASMKIPSLNLEQTVVNSRFGDPGWYFLLWTLQNKIKCKNIDIDEFIAHKWYGSENRIEKEKYEQSYEKFKNENRQYLQ